jgi:L-amino acid N-acyltransferase YncA
MGVEIRLANTNDAAGVLAIYAPYCESTPITFEIAPPSVDQIRDRITSVMASYPWLVAEADGRVLGYVYGTRFRERAGYRWTAEVAVYIAEEAKQRGLGKALYTTLFAILRAQGFAKAIAGITVPNPASVRLHESLGFVRTGIFPGVGYKDGNWLDVGWWQLQLQPEVPNPREPELFSAVRDSAIVAAAIAEGEALLRG